MAEFAMPSLGADMEAGTLVTWLKHPGDHVDSGDIIAEVETDKGVIEVQVFESGRLDKLLVTEGTKVPVGTPLAWIEGDAPAERERISPAARRLAEELGVDAHAVSGTGPGGAVTREDVARQGRGAPKPSERMRQAIAAAMSRSNREIPHYFVSHTFAFTPVLDWLERHNASRPVEERLVYGAVLLKAVARALADFPELNARWEDDRVVPSPAVHIGIAVSLRDGGLVIPALHDVERLSLPEVMRGLTDLVERARRGQLRSSELTDGTITVTSLGERGVESVQGVIYPPQTALVGFGTPVVRPWVEAERLVARTVLTATLAADHRASDGHRGGRFLARLERALSEPEKL
jgi:pyruvate dehydrogenase E2 component (dihydrolipoamide acetyltransferase)